MAEQLLTNDGSRPAGLQNSNQDSPEGQPQPESELTARRRRRRRGHRRRPTARTRSRRNQAKKLAELFLLQLSLSMAQASPSKWYNLTSPQRRQADERGQHYWAVMKDPPTVRVLGWGNGPSKLFVEGNATVLVGDGPSDDIHRGAQLGTPEAAAVHTFRRPMTFVAYTQPIYFTAATLTNLSDYCLQLRPVTVTSNPHFASDLHNHTTRLNVSLLAIPHSLACTKAQRQAHFNRTAAPAPCPEGLYGTVWGTFKACSTGVFSCGPTVGNVSLHFWGHVAKYKKYRRLPAPAPVAFPYGTVHSELWKVGLALAPTNTTVEVWPCFNSTKALTHCRDFTGSMWKTVFGNANSTCHHRTEGKDTLCYRWRASVRTPPDEAFLLCHPDNTSVTPMPPTAGLPRYNVTCLKATLTDTIDVRYKDRLIFLVRRVPYQLLPVKAEQFALTPTDELWHRVAHEPPKAPLTRTRREAPLTRVRRDAGGIVFGLLNLAIEIYEEFQIQELRQSIDVLASTLQTFMHEELSAWTVQNAINNHFQLSIGALATTVLWLGDNLQLTQLYMHLPCHYKYAPLCVTPLPVNGTNTSFPGDWNSVRAALQGTLLAENATGDIQQLALFIEELRNTSAEFQRQRAQEANDLIHWLDGLVNFQWLTTFLVPAAFLLVTCVCLPCLLRCVCALIRRAILDAKADLRSLLAPPQHPHVQDTTPV
ncbi:uncharacterized protein [Notamacropus eugenii]|uniref:uncharacterized protein n=1 Tax=Notamacropus eugenii TaxID=9315 RepID=UPI003B67A02F